jgi:hypothetical protein
MPAPDSPPEDPGLWRKIHNLWISEVYHALKPQVAGRLSISIDQEVTLVELGQGTGRLRPDLHLSEGGPLGGRRPPPAGKEARAGLGDARPTGAVAYAEGVEECSTESRHFRGWAWRSGGELPRVPWDLGEHGAVEIDLGATLQEALRAGGFSRSATGG